MRLLILFVPIIHENLMEGFAFVALLKSCAKKKDLSEGRRLHAEILQKDLLPKNPCLANSIINVYSKCGMLAKAQDVLDMLTVRDNYAWNALIAGYAEEGKCHEVLNCFERMRNEGMSPDVVTYTCIIKACGTAGFLDKGRKIHDEVSRSRLLEKDIMLSSALVDMYAKCGAFPEAEQVVKELPTQCVASWNALIVRYAQHGQGHKALDCFKRMQRKSISPDVVTFICVLKACAAVGAIEEGQKIHEELVVRGLLEKDILLCNSLVNLYGKCGLLEQATKILETIPRQTVSSWNALISGHVLKGQYHEALHCFEWMQRNGHSPDAFTFTCVLKACGRIGSVDKGNQIHHKIVNKGLFQKDLMLCNALLDMYIRCGSFAKSEQVFDELLVRDVVTWNVLLSGCVQHDQSYKMLNYFQHMQSEGCYPDQVTLICILGACSDTRDIRQAEKIHDEIIKRGLLQNVALSNALIDVYAKYGAVAKAESVLRQIPIRDVISWNALISGCVQHRLYEKSLNYVEQMQSDGISPDKVTFLCILKVCAIERAIDKGEEIHSEIVNSFLLDRDIMLATALIDMYGKFGMLGKAQKVLEELSVRNEICWSALIAAYAQHGNILEAFKCVGGMQSEGLSPSVVTYISILKACGSTKSIKKGQEVHDTIVRMGLLEEELMLGNALIDMYAKCGNLVKAQKVLEELPVRDNVSWNTLIAGYANFGQCYEALDCFDRMKNEGFSPSIATFICMVRVYGTVGAIHKGKQIHEEIESRGLLKDVVLGNALVDMYVKCGVLTKARQLLEKLPVRDEVSWSVLISGCAQHGLGQETMSCFQLMQNEGLSPDAVTLLSVLSSCCSSGLLNEAQSIFGNMSVRHGIYPNSSHHIRMVSTFGRVGQFDKAMSVIKVMPPMKYPDAWLALLGACRKWGNLTLGQLAFNEVLKLDSSCAPAYVLMADVFVTAGMHKDAERVVALKLKYASRREQKWIDANLGPRIF